MVPRVPLSGARLGQVRGGGREKAGPAGLERVDPQPAAFCSVAVEAVQQAVVGVVVELERLVELRAQERRPGGRRRRPRSRASVVLDRRMIRVTTGWGSVTGTSPIFGVVAEDVGEAGRDDGMEAVVHDAHDRVLREPVPKFGPATRMCAPS